jgi:hypothetical protein
LVAEQADPRAYALAEKSAQERLENGLLVTAVQMGTLAPVEDTNCVNGKNVAGLQHMGARTTEGAKRKKDQHHFQWLLDELDRQIEAIQKRINQLTQDLADAQRRREEAQAKFDKLSEESLLIHDLTDANFNERWTPENRKRFERLTGTSTEGFSMAGLNLMLQDRTLINRRALGVAHAELSSAVDDERSIQDELNELTERLDNMKAFRKTAKELPPDQPERATEIMAVTAAIAIETQGHDFQTQDEKSRLQTQRSTELQTAEYNVNANSLAGC